MPDIKDVGDVIASRELEFHADNGTVEQAILKVGRPFEDSDGQNWVCPYELSTKSHCKLFRMHGIDPLQALSLTLKTLRTEIEYWERTQHGKFYFLGEEGAEV